MSNILISIDTNNINTVLNHFKNVQDRAVLVVDIAQKLNLDFLQSKLSQNAHAHIFDINDGNYIQYITEDAITDWWVPAYDYIVFSTLVSQDNIERFSQFLITPSDTIIQMSDIDSSELLGVLGF